MAFAKTSDDVALYYEEHGEGKPLLFIHEFAGDHRSWSPQIHHFSRRYRCIVYGARGFPPSDVPTELADYSQLRAVDDALTFLDAANAATAHVVGNSMGGFTALHLGLRHADRVTALVVSGCGYGAHPSVELTFRVESERIATAFESEGSAGVAEWYGFGPARVQYQNKDPHGHDEHVQLLREHSAIGAALTMRGVQMTRPSLYAMHDELSALDVPVLIIAGDEDDGVLETDLMLKRTLPRCGLAVLPRSGHVTNLEEPILFNQLTEQFFNQVEHGRWGPRDPRSLSSSITGVR